MRYDICVRLSDVSTGDTLISYARNEEDPSHFSYWDDEDHFHEVFLDEGGLTLFRHDDDHLTELFFHGHSYIRITGEEGTLQFDVKVLAFERNDDILLFRYLIGDDEKALEITVTGV